MGIRRKTLYLLISLIIATQAFAHHYYTGFSGAPGTSNTCASSCHGAPGGTVMVNGFPSAYNPGQTYTIHVLHGAMGGVIANFNSSCRIGTGSNNAGNISAGDNTAPYNVSGETNGVAMVNAFVDSANFLWTAPAAGSGAVRLYLAAHQSLTSSGLNTELVLTSAENTPPAAATNPFPVNNATAVSLTPTLTWNSGARATSHDVYFGTNATPPFVRNQTTMMFNPGTLNSGTVYYWRIDERNDVGVTQGSIWTFTTATGSAPAPQALTILPDQSALHLSWNPVPGATHYAVYRAATLDVPLIPMNLIGTPTDTTFTDNTAFNLSMTKAFYTVTAIVP